MAVRTDFVAGEVLAAQDLDDTFAAKVDYALPVNTQTGTTYTFVLADGLRLTTASNASASTFTIPPQSSVVWLANSVIRLVNFGAGVVTFAGGSGVTVTNAAKTLAQFESAACIRTGSNAWTVVPFSGAGEVAANFSDAATGTYTDGGVDFKFITYNSSGTLTCTVAGLADVLVIGGGAGTTSGGGGAGGYFESAVPLSVGVLTVTVGGGGATATNGSNSALNKFGAFGGGQGGIINGNNAQGGGSGGGAGRATVGAFLGGAGFQGQGFAGGNNVAVSPFPGGGGGGASQVGFNGVTTASGAGGAGLASSITGSSVTRGGGGGGGGASGNTAGAGGVGGGGDGSATTNGSAGTVNTGGGGGGGGNSPGGAGGSGVVIIRVRTN